MFITYSTSVLRLFLVSFLLISCGHKNNSTEFVQATSTQVIAVAYKDLYQQADALYESSTSCLLSTTDYVVVLEQLKPQWMRAWAAWQSVQWVQFGPIKQDGREWALQFWPDKKNLVGNKLKRLLVDKDFINSKTMEQEGVIVQGFSALEYLLFDESAQVAFTSRQRCLAVNAIAKKALETSKSLNDDWQQYDRDNFWKINDPVPHAEILSAEQAVSIIINDMIVAIDIIIGKKISAPFAITVNVVDSNQLSYNNKKINPYFLESWRSQTSLVNIKQNLFAIESVMSVGGLSKLLVANNHQQLSQSLGHQIKTLLILLESDTFEESFFMQLSQNKRDSAKHIEDLYSGLLRLRVLLSRDVSDVLGIRLGFNASDGDS